MKPNYLDNRKKKLLQLAFVPMKGETKNLVLQKLWGTRRERKIPFVLWI